VDYGTCDTPSQNDIRKSETKQCTKAEAMQQSIFPRPVRLVVIQEPFIEISQQCHESYAVKYAKTQENKRKSARVTVEAEPGTRHKNQRCRGKSQHDLRYVHVALVAMLEGHRFTLRVGRSECRWKAVPYFDGIYSDTSPNKGENSQASYQREYDCHCPHATPCSSLGRGTWARLALAHATITATKSRGGWNNSHSRNSRSSLLFATKK
jgi:hypothetical protein